MNPSPPVLDERWKTEFAQSFTRITELLEYLELPLDQMEPRLLAAQGFAFRVPAGFAARMRKGDPADPLLRQVLPTADELAEQAGFIADPVGDLQAEAVPGLLHKYHGRALLITTGACAINCRYCFRREFPYAQSQASRSREVAALAHIEADKSISEVILSGGDPLVLDDTRLAGLVAAIAAIPQVRRLRVHTRLPVVLPSRVTDRLVEILGSSRLNAVVVIHANHANELDEEVGLALARLRGAKITLLNQSVLLRGVNDSALALTDLSESLLAYGVTPYYLHLLDKAKGTGHFDIAEQDAKELHEALRRILPGYLVPRLVREMPGAPYKSLV